MSHPAGVVASPDNRVLDLGRSHVVYAFTIGIVLAVPYPSRPNDPASVDSLFIAKCHHSRDLDPIRLKRPLLLVPAQYHPASIPPR